MSTAQYLSEECPPVPSSTRVFSPYIKCWDSMPFLTSRYRDICRSSFLSSRVGRSNAPTYTAHVAQNPPYLAANVDHKMKAEGMKDEANSPKIGYARRHQEGALGVHVSVDCQDDAGLGGKLVWPSKNRQIGSWADPRSSRVVFPTGVSHS